MSQLAMKETPGSLLDTEKYYSIFPVSSSTRRVWIEMVVRPACAGRCRVTLHPEGVDRNWVKAETLLYCALVTLHLEGVDISMGCFCPMSFVILKASGWEKCFSLGNREKIVSLMERKSPRMVFGNWKKDR